MHHSYNVCSFHARVDWMVLVLERRIWKSGTKEPALGPLMCHHALLSQGVRTINLNF